jgi:hypothetical protein
MGFIAAAGTGLNFPGTETSNPAADSAFPVGALQDGRIDAFFSQGSILADSTLRRDLNVIINGGLETGDFTGWTKVELNSGVVTIEPTIVNSGSKSAKLATSGVGGTEAGIKQTKVFRSGQRVRGTASLRATSGTVKLEIKDLTTGKYYNTSSVWQTARTHHKITASTGSYETFALSIVLDGWEAHQSDFASLQVYAFGDSTSAQGYADDIYVWPETNLCVLAGHNVDPAITCEWRKSTDNFAANDVLVGALTARRGVMYRYETTAIVTRYVGLKFVGTPEAKIRATELIYTYALDTQRGVRWEVDHSSQVMQERSAWQSLALQDYPADGFAGVIDAFPIDTAFYELRDEIFRRAERGQMIILILSTTRDVIVIGRTPPDWAYSTQPNINVVGLKIDPFPPGIWTA